MLPAGYNDYYLILQTPDHVAIHVEMIHDTRIIPAVAGRGARRWEDDTLVVETRNIARSEEGSSFSRDAARIRPANGGRIESLRVVERFTGRRRHAALRVHGRGPDALDQPVVRRAAPAADRRDALRVRLPRGQLRHRQHAEWHPAQERQVAGDEGASR